MHHEDALHCQLQSEVCGGATLQVGEMACVHPVRVVRPFEHDLGHFVNLADLSENLQRVDCPAWIVGPQRYFGSDFYRPVEPWLVVLVENPFVLTHVGVGVAVEDPGQFAVTKIDFVEAVLELRVAGNAAAVVELTGLVVAVDFGIQTSPGFVHSVYPALVAGGSDFVGLDFCYLHFH